MEMKTGAIHEILSETKEDLKLLMERGNLVELSKEEADILKPMERLNRKNWMRNKPCVCQSGKKFKKCCWSRFQ